MAEGALRGSPLAWRVFEAAFRPWMASRVRVHLTGRPGSSVEPGFPLVLVANHESWWDGFLLRAVQRRLRPGAPFRTVMLERELAPRPFLRWLGGLGVTPGSVGSGRRLLSTLRSLRCTDPDTVLAYFPQGAIRPGSPRPLAFRPGVIRVVEALAPATVLPVGIRVTTGVTSRLDAYVSVGEPLAVPARGTLALGLLEAAVSEEVEALDAHLRTHGEAAAERWPGPRARIRRAPRRPPALPTLASWISRN